jgi:hypothetical protein
MSEANTGLFSFDQLPYQDHVIILPARFHADGKTKPCMSEANTGLFSFDQLPSQDHEIILPDCFMR